MKRIIAGILLGILISAGATASADYVVHTANHSFLYKTTTYNVDTFTDNGNRCYVATSSFLFSGNVGGSGNNSSISCVQQ